MLPGGRSCPICGTASDDNCEHRNDSIHKIMKLFIHIKSIRIYVSMCLCVLDDTLEKDETTSPTKRGPARVLLRSMRDMPS